MKGFIELTPLHFMAVMMSSEHNTAHQAGVLKVFISYSHDSDAHKQRVEELADALKRDGFQVALDQWVERPPVDWALWCSLQLKPENSDWVLMISTEGYWKKVEGTQEGDGGRGVHWEGRIIRAYYYEGRGMDARFLPVSLDENGLDHLPKGYGGQGRYRVRSFDQNACEGYNKLLRVMRSKAMDIPVRGLPASGQASGAKAAGGAGHSDEVKDAEAVAVLSAAERSEASPEVDAGAMQGERRWLAKTGAILVADVAGFSDGFDDDTRAIIFAEVWGFVRDDPRLQNKREVYKDNTLDGAVVCLDGPRRQLAVEVALDWVKGVAERLLDLNVPKVQLRVGIGFGDFQLESRGASGTVADLIPFGKAVNEIDRLTRIAGVDDTGHRGFVILDETFTMALKGQAGVFFSGKVAPALYPPMGEPACCKQAKVRHLQYFRVLNVYEQRPLILSGVKELISLGHAIQKTMKDMAERLWEYLGILDPDFIVPQDGHGEAESDASGEYVSEEFLKNKRREAKLRVSIFCKDPRYDVADLVCTNFRYLDWKPKSNEKGGDLAKPSTEYSLGDPANCGPVAAAFLTRECVFLNHLPEVKSFGRVPTDRSLKEYVAALRARNFGLSEGTARVMSRHARAFFCLPLGLHPDTPTAVACLDLATPVSWINDRYGEMVAGLLQEEFGTVTALLFDKRG